LQLFSDEIASIEKRSISMRDSLSGTLGALALLACLIPVRAGATDSDPELAFMRQTMNVTLLNEGGKYVVVDLKHIPKGGTCRMDKDALIARVGPGEKPGTTRVRYVGVQVNGGGCPFLTTFDMTDSDYAAAHQAFLQMKEEASKKVEEVKKDLGRKWDEVIGNKD
jgi:hypothetical protein